MQCVDIISIHSSGRICKRLVKTIVVVDVLHHLAGVATTSRLIDFEHGANLDDATTPPPPPPKFSGIVSDQKSVKNLLRLAQQEVVSKWNLVQYESAKSVSVRPKLSSLYPILNLTTDALIFASNLDNSALSKVYGKRFPLCRDEQYFLRTSSSPNDSESLIRTSLDRDLPATPCELSFVSPNN